MHLGIKSEVRRHISHTMEKKGIILSDGVSESLSQTNCALTEKVLVSLRSRGHPGAHPFMLHRHSPVEGVRGTSRLPSGAFPSWYSGNEHTGKQRRANHCHLLLVLQTHPG